MKGRYVAALTLAALVDVIVGFVAGREFTLARPYYIDSGLEQSVNIVVAAHDLPVGTRLDPTTVTLRRWSRYAMPPGAFTDIAAVTGKYTKTEFGEDEPIVSGHLR